MAGIGTTTAPGEFLAPYVPSPEVVVDRMLELAHVGPGDVVYDLGSGDGRIVVAAAQRFGARAVGFELDDARFALASARVRDLGLGPRAQIVHGDLLRADLRPATVVTLYQLPVVNDMLRPVLERQLRPGARVVTLDFPVYGWEATNVVTGRLTDGSQHAIYLYTVGGIRKESATMATIKQSYTSTFYSLELQGVTAGVLKSLEGGDASADVVSVRGPDQIARKHLANLKYSDIAIAFGLGMSSDLYDWMSATLQRQYARKDGSLVGTDLTNKAASRLDFFRGVISEISFPECNASSKDAARITIKISPDYTTSSLPGSGQKALASSALKSQKMLQSSQFRLKIDGLDCSRVSAIDALTVSLRAAQSAIGEDRSPQLEAAGLDIPNLAVTFAESATDGFRDWFDEFVIKGKAQNGTRNGTLEYLGANLQDVLFTLTFANLGIFSLAQQKIDSGIEKIRRVRAEMYCEELTFTYGASATSGKGASAGQGAAAGATSTPPSSGTYAATPLYVVPYVASVADKAQVASQQPQDFSAGAASRLGRPLKFRS